MEQSLQTKNALGYGVASIAESSMYQLVNGYLLLYLTSVVGVGADKAGLVMSVGMVFETMAGLIIGFVHFTEGPAPAVYDFLRHLCTHRIDIAVF